MRSNCIRPRGWRVALSAFVLAVLIGTPPAFGATAKRSSQWSFNLRAEGQVKYDDNILMLSDSQKRQLDDPALRNSDRFRIESAADVILAPELSIQFNRSPRARRETGIRLNLGAYDYVRNSVKDYQEYELSVRQELNRSRAHRTALSVGGSHIPSYYLRQLTDDDASQTAGMTIRSSADYRKNRVFLEFSQQIVEDVLSVEAGHARERRDYNDQFNERDSSSGVTYAELNVYPLRKIGFRIQPYYRHENRTSRGDLASSVVPDDDVGFQADRYGLDLRWLWGKDRDHRDTFKVYYYGETREFSTSIASDTSHFDRQDDVSQYGLSYDRELGPRLRMAFAGYRRNVDVSLPSSGTTPFKKNVVSAAIVYNFDRRFSHQEKEEAP